MANQAASLNILAEKVLENWAGKKVPRLEKQGFTLNHTKPSFLSRLPAEADG